MTKILCLSDTQLGAGRNLTPDRLADQEAVLGSITALAEGEGVDLVLHCGDVFDSRHPSEEARMVFKRFARKTGLTPFVVVSGNHDLRNADLPSAVDLYDDCWFVRKPDVLRHEGLAIACLPWTPLSRLVASRNGDRAAINEEAADLLIETAKGLREQCGDGPATAILAGHWMVSSGSLPNGLPVERLGGPVLPLTEIEALGFDAALFGDVHVPAILSPGSLHADENGSHHAAGKPIISVGSPALNDWGEEHVPHGVWILDVLTKGDGSGEGSMPSPSVSARFVPIEDRRFMTVNVNLLDGYKEGAETDAIEAAIGLEAGDVLSDTVLRVRYRATPEQARCVDAAAIRRLIEDAGGHLAKLECVPVRVERARIEGLTETLPPLKAVAMYVAHNGIEGAFADRVGGRIARYLSEVEA